MRTRGKRDGNHAEIIAAINGGRILAIDPGSSESAYVIWDGSELVDFDILGNDHLVEVLLRAGSRDWAYQVDSVVIEQIRSYGMAVGSEVFDTCVWSGRFCQAFGPDRVHWLPRLQVKLNLCMSSKANDSNIRQALMDRFGGKSSVGTKKTPGPLYGVSKDLWAALGVAVTWKDLQRVGAVAPPLASAPAQTGVTR